jgi:drug/metabolite transporter (DMT)-like permease
MFRVLTAMIVACAAAAGGQILVRRGMQQVGELDSWAPLHVLHFFWHALTNPYVVAGTAGNALFYFLFVAVLSWTDVTVALPLTALEYAFAAVLSVLILKEVVPPLRWTGIALVILGVILIGADQKHQQPQGKDPIQDHEDRGAAHDTRKELKP